MGDSGKTISAFRDHSLPAWIISLMVHTTLLAMLAMLLHNRQRGAADESVRTVGIVLKRFSEDGELYAGEEDQAAVANAESSSDLLQALPQESATPEVSNLLPALSAIGPGAAFANGLPNAGELTLGGGGRRSLGGGKTRVSVFGVEGIGSKFVYVFDRSVSMEGAPLAVAQAELIESLTSLENIHQFQIVFFNHRLRVFDISGGQRRIAYATEANKELAARFVAGMTADGGTDRYAALVYALRLRPDAIFFLTDADDPMPAVELAELEARNRRGGATVNTIEFGRGPPREKGNFLTRLAQQSGGQYGYVDTLKLRRESKQPTSDAN